MPRLVFDLTSFIKKSTFGGSNPKDITIFNDCGDDKYIIKCKGYKCIGSRYKDINSKEHKDYIEDNNNHLRSGTPAYRYPEESNHPLWDIY
jgi:hypothetical protein